MKIAFHDNSLCLRGTTVALYDYAWFTRKILGNDAVILYDTNHPLNDKGVHDKFANEFEVYGYSDKSQIDKILENEKCDAFFMIKGGKPDGVISNVCKNWINAIAVCNTSHIHGDIFAMGSKWLSKITDWQIPYVPYMVSLPDIKGDMREELNISKDALVLGRNGGQETFDIDFAKHAIVEILNKRSDIWFVFQNTYEFVKHERVIYLNGSSSLDEKVKFINTCDAMIHARYVGESFGLSCAEFSIKNKPVITYFDSPERNHIEVLGEKGIYYKNKEDLVNIFSFLDKKYLNSNQWNMYQDYTPERVIELFKTIYK